MIFSLGCLLLAGALPGMDAASVRLHQSRAVTNTSKAGLGWPNGNTVDIKQFETTGKVSWYHSWSTWPTDSELEFSPLFWGNKSIQEFNANLPSVMRKTRPKITAVLGMNEPEIPTQSNLTAQEGAQMWQTYMQPLRSTYPGIRLGSPAPSSSPMGKKWLQDFFTACNGNCTVDFIATHWYGIDADAFITYLKDMNTTFQKPIWITEWACQNYVDFKKQCSQDDVVSFMNKTQTFMDNADFVERYAWFGAMRDMQGVNQYNALMDKSGKITALGAQYIGANASQISGGLPSISVNYGLSRSSSTLITTCALLIGVQLLFFLI